MSLGQFFLFRWLFGQSKRHESPGAAHSAPDYYADCDCDCGCHEHGADCFDAHCDHEDMDDFEDMDYMDAMDDDR